MSNSHLLKVDYSQSAIKNVVTKRTLSHPISVYPSTIGLLGLISAGLFASVPAAIVGGGGIIFGIGIFLVNRFFRYDQQVVGYLNDMRELRKRHGEEYPDRLKGELGESDFKDGVNQVDKLRDKFENLKKVLSDKFEETELTYSRYLGAAEEVYFSSLDRLQSVVSILKSVQTIDLSYIKGELKKLHYKEGDKREEVKALLERKKLYDDAFEKVNQLYKDNEKAMTSLDTTAFEIAKIQTKQGRASIDMEKAMSQLMDLAKQAHIYETH